eukprot:TRINITY_DN11785_c0_g2_i1.p1 TRINITY_DN11785_c0_g2~~TRINITY_DN11785_c0_g2_i1.p1  ORF type:complete len:187 (+),score=33.06 TRINITY_DN11785_c0_g2_i1:165-725(+)
MKAIYVDQLQGWRHLWDNIRIDKENRIHLQDIVDLGEGLLSNPSMPTDVAPPKVQVVETDQLQQSRSNATSSDTQTQIYVPVAESTASAEQALHSEHSFAQVAAGSHENHRTGHIPLEQQRAIDPEHVPDQRTSTKQQSTSSNSSSASDMPSQEEHSTSIASWKIAVAVLAVVAGVVMFARTSKTT